MNGLPRALTLLGLCALLVGFGVCGAYGTAAGLNIGFGSPEAKAFAAMFLVPGVIGLVIALVFLKMIVTLWRKPPAE